MTIFFGPQKKSQGQGRGLRVFIVVAFFLWVSAGVFGAFSSDDAGTRGPALLKKPVGVRAVGVGGSFVGVADDASALFWNPAGIDQLAQPEILFMHADSFFNQTQDFIGYVKPVWWAGERRTLGVNVSYLSIPGFDVVEDEAPVDRARPSDLAVGVSYAQPWRSVHLGATMKAIRQQGVDTTAHAYALDMGVFAKPREWFSWGASLANVGTALRGGPEPIALPTVFRAGFGHRILFLSSRPGKDTVLLTGAVEAPWDDGIAPQVGTEYSRRWGTDNRASVRLGYHGGSQAHTFDNGAFAIGAGIDWRSFRLNYAYRPHEALGAAQFLDLSVRWGSPLAQETKRRELIQDIKDHAATGDLAKAQASLKEALAISPRHEPIRRLDQNLRQRFADSLDPATLFSSGQDAFRRKEYEKAADLFRKILVIQPTHKEAADQLAKTETVLADHRLAQLKEQVAQTQRKEREDIVRSAVQDMDRQRWAAALTKWKRLLTLDPSHVRAKTGVEECLKGIYQEARGAEKDGDLTNALAMYYSIQRETPSYRDVSKRIDAINAGQRDRNAKEGLEKYTEGVRAYQAGDRDRARALFEEAHRLLPDDKTIQRALERMTP